MAGFSGFGDKVAIIDGITEEQRTFADIIQDVNGVARSLQSMGIKKGDVVGLFVVILPRSRPYDPPMRCATYHLRVWTAAPQLAPQRLRPTITQVHGEYTTLGSKTKHLCPPPTNHRLRAYRYTPNHVDFFTAFHGIAKLGATVTLMNPLYTKWVSLACLGRHLCRTAVHCVCTCACDHPPAHVVV